MFTPNHPHDHCYYSGSCTLFHSFWKGRSLFTCPSIFQTPESVTINNMQRLFPNSDHAMPVIEMMATSLWRRFFLVVNAFDDQERRRKRFELWSYTRDSTLVDKYGHNEEFVRVDFFKERGLEILEMISGAYFVLFMTSDGVYGIGENKDGQLGVGNNQNQIDFVKIESLNGLNIKKIACGTFFTMILTQESEVYGFGLNHWGQLGLGHDSNRIVLPTKLEMFGIGKIELDTIYCGDHNTFFLTTESKSTNYMKQLYGCGYAEFGQLTEQYREKLYFTEPVLIDFFSNTKERTVKDMCSSYGFSFVLTQEDELYSFGIQDNGELGTKTVDNIIQSITKVELGYCEWVRNMNCGTRQAFFLTRRGSVFNTGTYFLTGRESLVNHYEPTKVFELDPPDDWDRVMINCRDEVFILINKVSSTRNQLLAKFIGNYKKLITGVYFSDISIKSSF